MYIIINALNIFTRFVRMDYEERCNKISGSSLLQAAELLEQLWQIYFFVHEFIAIADFEVNIASLHDFVTLRLLYLISNNVARKKIYCHYLLIGYWFKRRKFAEFTLHDR